MTKTIENSAAVEMDSMTCDRIYGRCKAVAARRLKRARVYHRDADDAAQDLAIQWLEGFRALEYKAERIAANYVRDEHRLCRGGDRVRSDLDASNEPKWDANPLMRIIAMEDSERLMDAMNELDSDVREVVRMRFFDGMEYGQIAEAIGLNRKSVQSVFNRLERGLSRLRDLLS